MLTMTFAQIYETMPILVLQIQLLSLGVSGPLLFFLFTYNSGTAAFPILSLISASFTSLKGNINEM